MSYTNDPNVSRNREPCGLPPEDSTHSFWHSEPSALLTGHRSTRELPRTADVVIVGSGITGTSAAYHLLTRTSGDQTEVTKGPSVVLLEAREACWGATGRNGGHCQPLLYQHPHEPSIGRFELSNYHAIKSLVEEKNIDCEFVPQSGVRAIYHQSHLNEVELALLTVQDTSPDLAKHMRLVTDKSELEKLRVPTAVGAVVTDIAARIWPYKLVSRILEDLVTSTDLNGTFNLQTLTPVECLAPYCGDRWTVKTPRGCLVASKVILATNGYTSHLLPTFADLIVPCRGQMSALMPLPSVAGDNRLKTSFGFEGDLGDYLIQRPNERGGHLMFGGGRHVSRVYTTDDSEIDDSTAAYLRTRLIENLGLPEGKKEEGEVGVCEYCRTRKLRCIRNSALQPCTNCRRRKNLCLNAAGMPAPFPNQPEFTATHEWTGIMGFSRDEHPWVGQIPDKNGIYISAGYTGHGMVNTWLCGKAVARMVELDLSAAAATTTAPAVMEDQGGDTLRDTTDNINGWNQQVQRTELVYQAAKEVGLPESYLVSRARILRAMDLEDVETRDWKEMERGRRRRLQAERPASGYA